MWLGGFTKKAFGAMAYCLAALQPTLHHRCRWSTLILPASMHSCKLNARPRVLLLAITYLNSPIVQMHVSKDSEGTPVPYIGVDNVARGIAFLASEESTMINGAMIPIDNAWSTI
jgi:NAD(P)-dependent dehydrogenase (short-subunit alcohol dehydrogenase family)